MLEMRTTKGTFLYLEPKAITAIEESGLLNQVNIFIGSVCFPVKKDTITGDNRPLLQILFTL
ncbi:MAG: hypothetical protein ABIH92_00545 [Nanoarchaeota archaeon]